MNLPSGAPPASATTPAAPRIVEPTDAGWPRAIQLAVLVVAYFAAARLGLTFAVVNESATAVWPPTGIALAALLLYGSSLWPAVFVGALLANFATSGSWPVAIGIATGNTVEALLGAWLVRRLAGGADALSRTADVFRFALFGGLVAPVASATIGVASLRAGGLAYAADAPEIWLTWWLGDAVGAMTVAPFVMLWARRSTSLPGRRDIIEVLLFITTALAAALVASTGLRGYSVEFLFVPVVLWAAFRFGQREAVTCAVGFSAVAVWSRLSGEGPSGQLPANQGLLFVQAYVGVMAMTGAAVGALAAEHNRLHAELAGRVDERTRALVETNRSLVEEIDHRQQAEAALRKSEVGLVEAQALAHVGSWEWDVPTDSVQWSEELCRIYGVPVGTSPTYEQFLQLVHPSDRDTVHRIVTRAFEDAHPFAMEHRIIRPDGVTRVLSARGRVLTDERGHPIRMLGTGQDVTERRQADDERLALAREQAARRQAEEASRLKDHFLAMVSHELRTPLNAVLGWAQVLSSEPPDPERLAKGLEVIGRNARAQQRLIEDLLDISQFTQGRIRLESAPVDVGTVVSAAVDAVSVAANARDIRIQTAVESNGIVEGDAQRLQQVVWNLLSNAVKFTEPGGTIDVAIEGSDDFVVLRVTDTGPGIDPAVLPHIFDVFWRGQTDRPHGGLGLGLAIVRALVEAHGGTVEARSTVGARGASFSVQLPRA